MLLKIARIGQWYHFDPDSGLRFLPFQEDLYESVFFKFEEPEKATTQFIFHIYPDIDVYHTNDVWQEHETKKGHWMFSGRMDDFVKLTSLTKFNATHIEGHVLKDRRMNAAIMGGDGRPVPFLLIELVDDVSQEEALDDLWQQIEMINDTMSRHIRLERDMIMFTTPGKPIPRIGNKHTTNRSGTIQLYAEEIENLYQKKTNILRDEVHDIGLSNGV
jgi:hypothetical protein